MLKLTRTAPALLLIVVGLMLCRAGGAAGMARPQTAALFGADYTHTNEAGAAINAAAGAERLKSLPIYTLSSYFAGQAQPAQDPFAHIRGNGALG